jgi:hypothetical protein
VAAASAWIGIAGTLATAGAAAAAAHFLFAFGWHAALLIGTAIAPTDPAVVFSVLGRREIAGRSGVLLEGESGANDPVGIALLVALLAAKRHWRKRCRAGGRGIPHPDGGRRGSRCRGRPGEGFRVQLKNSARRSS